MNQLAAQKFSGTINRAAIEVGFMAAKVGRSLLEVDFYIDDYITSCGCMPAFKGYMGYKHASCLSPNQVVVHGVPNNYILKDGDILTIDVGTIYDGWYSDAAETRIVLNEGQYTEDDDILFKCCLIGHTNEILQAQMNAVQDGCSLLTIMETAERIAKQYSVNLFPNLGGHFIGRQLHMDPFIPNTLDYNLPADQIIKIKDLLSRTLLKIGDVLCLEPVTTFGSTQTTLNKDGWTLETNNKNFTAHAETCIIVTEKGHSIIS